MKKWVSLVQLLLLPFVTVRNVTCAHVEGFYITASPGGTPCPYKYTGGERCLTLQQYVSNPSRSSDGVTLEIHPGTHVLTSDLSVSNTNQFKILATGDNATISCSTRSVQMSFTSVDSVVISGVSFEGCNATTMTAVSHVSISAVSYNNSGDIAFRMVQAIHISDVSYNYWSKQSINFNDIGELNVIRTAFLQQIQTDYKDGVYMKIDNVNVATIQGSEFNAVQVYLSAVENCSFVRSRFYSYHHYYSDFEDVGILTIQSSTVAVKRCNFTDNHQRAVFAVDTNVTIHQSTFSNNSVFYKGGAILMYQREQDYYTDCYYYGDQPRRMSSLIITNCKFSGNVAGTSGGAIYSDSVSISIANCSFEGNKVSNVTGIGSGGAVYVVVNGDSSMSVMQSTFQRNRVDMNGGAIYASSSSSSVLLNGTNFTDNTAGKNGGAVYLNVTQSHDQSCDNTADVDLNATSQSYVSVHRSNFIHNTAVIGGGGAVYSGAINLSTPADISISESTFRWNSAAFCGVLDVGHHLSDITIYQSFFSNNQATTHLIGGGVACVRNSTLSISSSAFTKNRAELHAGVLYVDEGLVTIEESSFIENSAAIDGGVLYTYVYPTSYTIRGSIFEGNRAGSDGGVGFVGQTGSVVRISASVFDGNNATSRGGVISVVGGLLEVSGTDMYNNIAEKGGVISSCQTSELQVSITGRDELVVQPDPELGFCELYDGNIDLYNINTTNIPIDNYNESTYNVVTDEVITTTGMEATEESQNSSTQTDGGSVSSKTTTYYQTESAQTTSSPTMSSPTPSQISGNSPNESSRSGHITALDVVLLCFIIILVVVVGAILTKIIYDAVKGAKSTNRQPKNNPKYRTLTENDYAEMDPRLNFEEL